MFSKIHITKEEEESKEVGRKDEGGWGRWKTNCVTNKIKRKEKVKLGKVWGDVLGGDDWHREWNWKGSSCLWTINIFPRAEMQWKSHICLGEEQMFDPSTHASPLTSRGIKFQFDLPTSLSDAPANGISLINWQKKGLKWNNVLLAILGKAKCAGRIFRFNP